MPVMPVPFPPEFRRRAVELATTSDKALGEVATELGISRSCLQNWVRQTKADTADDSAQLTSAEKKELVELRRRAKQLEVENEILKRAAAYFARENILPK
jgi:transposase